MSKLFTIIMAGGRGERLWPRSNNEVPKQFAKVVSDKTMLEETIERSLKVSQKNHIYISTLKGNVPLLKAVVPKFPATNIITEPIIRDTSCAILLSTLSIPAQDHDVLVFMPADHYIKNLDKFKSDITAAFHNTRDSGKVTLIGIPPSYASTEYGYLRIKTVKASASALNQKPSQVKRTPNSKVLHIEKFVEKPNLRKAQGYMKSGQYLWNSGIFMFNRGYLLELFQKHTPKLYAAVSEYLALIKARKTTKAVKVFEAIEKVSFDYAIAEKIHSISCVRSTFFWDDVGNWEAFFRIKPTDSQGNIVIPKKNSFIKDSKDNLCLIDDNRFVMLNGVNNLIVISNKDNVYIAHRNSAKNIKGILKEMGNEKNSKNNKKNGKI